MNSQIQKTTETNNFDYHTLDFQKRNEIEQATAAIRERLKKAAQDIWEIGKMLNDVQLKLKRGQFDDWIKTEFDWSRRTAYKFISVYKRFDNSVNLGEINIATSALYLLAAESTPEEIREEFIQKAQSGTKITHQQVLKVVKKARDNSEEQSEITSILESDAPQPTISTIPNTVIEKPLTFTSQADKNSTQTRLIVDRGWYELENKHRIFCGDTALPEFVNNLPYAALAIAVTTDDWAHDWLIEKAKTVVVFPESEYDQQKLTGLIVMFSNADDKVILPWLPQQEMIAVIHQLGRQVHAGDIENQKCQSAINYAGFAQA